MPTVNRNARMNTEVNIVSETGLMIFIRMRTILVQIRICET